MTHNRLHNKYLNDSNGLLHIQSSEKKSISWVSPANIALIKYWGKHGNQLPNNPSISFTLSKSQTQMSVTYESIRDKAFSLEFYLDDIEIMNLKRNWASTLSGCYHFYPF
jgi:diphosphomevalonate decarboxylase